MALLQPIEPVKLDESDPQLCRILYSDEYKHTIGTVLALLRDKEYSPRALEWTLKAIDLLASHYTLWSYRFDIVCAIDYDLWEELEWCEQIALENEKNYQIWNYRQLIIERICKKETFDPHHELPILAAMLQEDPKNHHVWSYRKWLVERFDMHNDVRELDFVDLCLSSDVLNNSAWTHRFFLKFAAGANDMVANSEIEYVCRKIKELPQNPAAWNYLLGIYARLGRDLSDLESFCSQFYPEEELVRSTYAMEVLARIWKVSDPDRSHNMYMRLAETYDPIRANYWRFCAQQ